MAEQSAAERLKILDAAMKKINDKAGKTIIGRLSDPEIADKVTLKFIPSVCLDINRITGGGWPRSRCTIIAGNENSGKTSKVLEDIAYNQQINSDFIALWVESEKSLDKDYILNMWGVDPKRFVFLEYEPDIGAEGILDNLYALMKVAKIDLVCINSLKCLTPRKEMDSTFDDLTPAVAARLNGKIVRKFTSIVAENETAFILITHTHTDINSYGSPQAISGGRAIRYWSTLSLMFTVNSLQKDDLITKEQGMKIAVSVKKNRCRPDTFPFVKFFYYAVFGKGTDQVGSAIPVLAQQGIIRQSGSSYAILAEDGSELKRFTGKKNLYEGLQEDRELFDSLIERTSSIKMTEQEIETVEKENKEEEIAAQLIENTPKVKTKEKKK